MKRLLFLLLMPISVFCQGIPDPKPYTYVNDQMGIISPQEENSLNVFIHSMEVKHKIQVAVVIARLSPDASIEEYALQVGRKWHVGNDRRGLVYVIDIINRRDRMEVAESLEGIIPDISANEIIAAAKPHYRSNEYYKGIMQVLNGINNTVSGAETVTAPEKKDQDSSLLAGLGIIASSFAGIIIFFLIRSYRKRREEVNKKVAENFKTMHESGKKIREHYESNKYGCYLSTPPIHSSTIITSAAAGGISGYYASRIDDEGGRKDDIPSYGGGYSSDSSSSNSSSSSSDYGSWGSSDNSPSDSGFSGGGSSDSW